MATVKTAPVKEYDDIPGTFVFDADRSRQGYHINMFCMSLMKDENRKAFKADEAAYLDRYPLTPEQREAILKRQWNRILELGGNIYFTAKLGATDGLSFQQVAAIMTGSTQEDYAKMMLGGGRSVEGNRSKSNPGAGPAPQARRGAARKAGKQASGTKKTAKKTAKKAANKATATRSVKAKPKAAKKTSARKRAS